MRKKLLQVLPIFLSFTLLASCSDGSTASALDSSPVTDACACDVISPKDFKFTTLDDGRCSVSISDENAVSLEIPSHSPDGQEVKVIGRIKCPKLVDVTLPDTAEEIGDWAFDECTKLVSVDIPDSVNVIGEEGFYRCYQLKSVHLPAGVKADSCAFSHCVNLVDINMEDIGEFIGDGVFYDCFSLKKNNI
jgi:hypothetical protein